MERNALPVIEVETGRVCVGRAGVALRANALGSCVAVALHAPALGRGALAHVMLPGSAPATAVEPTRYADEAISEALRLLDANPEQLTATIAGGANVLREPDGEPLCHAIRESVVSVLTRHGIAVCGSSLGGTERRAVKMLVETGEVYCAVGDGPELRVGLGNAGRD